MTLDEARACIGHLVRYTPTIGAPEVGEIVSVNDEYVFVRYVNGRGGWKTQSEATRPEDLEEMVEIWPFPWPEPRSQYDTDGPVTMTTVILPDASGADAAIYRVIPTGDDGLHTARDRFCVECVTCGEVLHRGTTGPSHRIRDHHRHTHAAEKR